MFKKKHDVQLGKPYISDKQCTEFIDNIAETFEDELRDTLGGCNFFSVLIDGSMDASKSEKRLMYILYINPHTDRQTSSFLSLEQIPKDLQGNASGLVSILKQALEDHNLLEKITNMVALEMDEASVNIGQRGGVYGLLKNTEGLS